ncbi:MAG: tetratricopeptide repeat protein, partial [Chloroflexota bacterium]
EARPHNLPAQRSLLIGRDREVAAVQHLLLRPDVGLVTLTGPGGIGKTRLAMQVAAELLDARSAGSELALSAAKGQAFTDGVCFVPLAPINDPELVISAIASCLDLRDAGGRPLLDLVREHLREKRLLLVLDNFEQVLAAGPLVADLLSACPRLKALVTSRAVLHLSGEHDFPVATLALPDAGHHSPAHELGRVEAVRLFVERAQAARPDFALTEENASAVAEVCRRLDGLPLAIELAAARVRLLPPQALLARLTGADGSASLRLLAGGARDLPARQQTLRATIEWSYDLLSPEEQALFRRLGVFVGGCTIDAGDYVSGVAGSLPTNLELETRNPELGVLEGLEGLVDKSLLHQDEGTDDEPRFRMLETVREYALEQVAASGELDAVRQAHASYFLALAERAEPQLYSPEQGVWLNRLEAEHGNLRAILRWSLERGDAVTALRLGGTLWRFWYVHGHLSEGRRWLEEALSAQDAGRSPANPEVQTAGQVKLQHHQSRMAIRANALNGAGVLAHYQGDFGTAAARCGESLSLYRRLGDKAGTAAALHGLALVSRSGGDYATARAMNDEALTLLRDLGDQWRIGFMLIYTGAVAWLQADYQSARVVLEESLGIWRSLGDQWGAANSLQMLGYVTLKLGDPESAQALCEEALAIFREFGDHRGMARALLGLGATASRLGNYVAAGTWHVESLTHSEKVGDRLFTAFCLVGLAGVAVAQGQPERAARLLGAEEALREAIGAPRAPTHAPDHRRFLAAAHAALGDSAFAAAFAAGRSLSFEAAVAEAMSAGEASPAAGPGAASSEDSPAAPLTAREQEVAKLIARGLTNKQIAAELIIAEGTADRHVSNILGKLDLTSRAQVAVWAVEHAQPPAGTRL